LLQFLIKISIFDGLSSQTHLLFPRILVWLSQSVADLEIQKGGFSHWRAKRAGKFLGCHTHFRSRWKSKLNISKQL